MKAINVKALSNYKISVVFADGISGVVDLSGLVQKGVFQKLKDERTFKEVHIAGSAIAWSDELEIDADNIYVELQHADPSQLLYKPRYYAAD